MPGATGFGTARRREIDKNVDSLINDYDVPRATSAPPHLQDGRWGAGPQVVRAHGLCKASDFAMLSINCD